MSSNDLQKYCQTDVKQEVCQKVFEQEQGWHYSEQNTGARAATAAIALHVTTSEHAASMSVLIGNYTVNWTSGRSYPVTLQWSLKYKITSGSLDFVALEWNWYKFRFFLRRNTLVMLIRDSFTKQNGQLVNLKFWFILVSFKANHTYLIWLSVCTLIIIEIMDCY